VIKDLAQQPGVSPILFPKRCNNWTPTDMSSWSRILAPIESESLTEVFRWLEVIQFSLILLEKSLQTWQIWLADSACFKAII
jgi:hypothetical protein